MTDDELRQWQTDWRQAPMDLAALQRRARREDHRHRVLAVAEYAVTGSLLLAVLVYALWQGGQFAWLWMTSIWLLGVPALLFAWWNRRGLWGQAGLNAQERLALSLRRCRHGLRALHVGYGVLVISAAVVALFAFNLTDGDRARTWTMLAWLAAMVGVHVLVMTTMHRRLHRRHQVLQRLQRDLDDNTM